MPLRFSTSRVPPDALDALVVGVYAEQLDAGEVPEPIDGRYLARVGFNAHVGEVRTVPGDDDRVLVAVGLGRRDEATLVTYRRAGAALAQASTRHRRVATTVLADAPESVETDDSARALAEGVVLGSYRFTAYKSDPKPHALERVVVVDAGGRATTAALVRGQAVADAVCVARDLVNEPGGTLTPSVFAERAVNLGKDHGFAVRVRDERAIQRAHMGGLLGVNRGSVEPPRFLELSWSRPGQPPPRSRTNAKTSKSARSARPAPTVALVGKGITFDSGGLSLKTTEGMRVMKGDMAGAAAVLGAFCALDAIRPRVQVKGFVPLTDNMPGGDATRVGDVLHIRNGTTVEVLNTDAEGRLVLADALVMASEARPTAIVDVATLTGACKTALGDRIAGLMGNDPALIERVQAAAARAGEDVWPLPLPRYLRSKLDSEIADLKNVAARSEGGGALLAGLFLQEFVTDGVPWAHLDIAGPAEAGEHDGEIRKGGTGFGVRTLVRLLEAY
ncbi:MAG: leucyl aminopeptidase [Acidimicrobiales bacterium]